MNAVLIVLMSSYMGHATVSMQDFNTVETCQSAREQIMKQASGRNLSTWCVPK